MELVVSEQAAAMGLAALLGALLGVCYDLLRVLRRRFPGGCLTALCDLCFWALCTGAVFCFAMTAGGGLLRLYAIFGTAAGALLWFLTLSPLFCRLMARLLGLVLLPAAAGARVFRLLRKKLKSLFPKREKQCMMDVYRLEEETAQKGESIHEGQSTRLAAPAARRHRHRDLRRGPAHPAEQGDR